jgi:hypothetical protein
MVAPWSGFGGHSVPRPGGRLKNVMFAGMLRWRAGPFSAGIEYLHSRLTSGIEEAKTNGQQLPLSGLFNF